MHNEDINNLNKCRTNTAQLFAILELVADRVEMHYNVGEQRDNWNTLLLNSINIITLTASTMSGIAATCPGVAGAPLFALKLSSTLLFSTATVLVLVMNKIQPSQLAEEQRNATRLFKLLETKIETIIALQSPTEEDVQDAIEKVLAIDRAYPLPILGAMLEKFPAKFEPAVWWPCLQNKFKEEKLSKSKEIEEVNGWSGEVEMELREVTEVTKKKDFEEYERIGNMVLKINKSLAITGSLLMCIAAFGSVFVGNESWLVPPVAASLAVAVNSFEHGGQVGMVFEMYRYCGGFLRLLEETIEATLEEKEVEKRENGEVFQMKVAMQLGRTCFQLRELASKSASYGKKGIPMDEFASKLF
ncbi:hypothetical protein VNO77_01778 [Canavalia gladiata]|uniref:F-box protein n=1 Tax=Canavalia gladiata TaxID=3824 RepID=A0AAN9MY94_CANGL